jgi:hypothetical protein
MEIPFTIPFATVATFLSLLSQMYTDVVVVLSLKIAVAVNVNSSPTNKSSKPDIVIAETVTGTDFSLQF